jgi:RNA polymerase sigma factor (sigma-70 family)
MTDKLSDEEVVEQVKGGDRESYGLLATRHHQRLHWLARRVLRDDSEAEDAVQGAHLLALRHLDQFEGRASYYQWMSSITANEARAHFRRNRVAVASEPLQDNFQASAPDPEQLALRGEIQGIVARALDRLPVEYSCVFRMRELSEMSLAETSRRLGLSDACVKTRLHRARTMLRRAIAPQLGRRGRALAGLANDLDGGIRE